MYPCKMIALPPVTRFSFAGGGMPDAGATIHQLPECEVLRKRVSETEEMILRLQNALLEENGLRDVWHPMHEMDLTKLNIQYQATLTENARLRRELDNTKTAYQSLIDTLRCGE